jgi:hypothetical protein
MKKLSFFVTGAAILTIFSAVTFSFPSETEASDVDFHIGIGIGFPPPPPPPVRIISPPEVYMLPQTPVYYSPSYETPVFFYSGYWYQPWNGFWYRAASYSGPWHHIEHRYVPVVIHNLPPRYHYRDHTYKEYRKNHFTPPGHQKRYLDKREKVKYQKYYY